MSLLIPGTPFPYHPVDTSNSEIKVWGQCQGKWFFKYVMGLQGKTKKVAPTFGRIVHEAFAEYYDPTTEGGLRTVDLLLDFAVDAYKAEVNKGFSDPGSTVYSSLRTILARYHQHYGDDDWNLLSTEPDFRVPVFDHEDRLGGFIHGRFDGYLEKEGKFYIIDHKTTKRFAFKGLEVDPQCDLYCVAGSKLFGSNFGGMIFNYIRSRLSPKRPNFQRIPVRRSSHEIRFLEANLAQVLCAMGSTSPQSVFFAYSDLCSWKCDYLDLCRSMRAGIPLETILSSSYTHRIRQRDEFLEL